MSLDRPAGPGNAATVTSSPIRGDNARRLVMEYCIGHGAAEDFALSGDGRRFAMGCASGVQVFDSQTLCILGAILTPDPVIRIALDHHGAVGAATMKVRDHSRGAPYSLAHYDLSSGRQIAGRLIHGRAWTVFHEDGTTSLSSESRPAVVNPAPDVWLEFDGGKVLRMETATGGRADELDWPFGLPPAQVAHVGQLGVIAGCRAGVRYWSLEDRARDRKLNWVDESVKKVRFARHGGLVVRLRTEQRVPPDGERPFRWTASEIWSLDGSRRKASPIEQAPLDPGIDASMNLKAVTVNRTLTFREMGDVEERSYPTDIRVGKREFDGQGQPCRCLALSPDGALLAGGYQPIHPGRGILRLWDVDSGRELMVHDKHSEAVTALAFAPSGRLLASACGHGGRVEGPSHVVFLIDTRMRVVVKTLEGHEEGVRDLAFSPDGALLASAAADGSVILWDVDSGQELRRLTGHAHEVTGVGFRSDGAQLASGSLDGTVRLWEIGEPLPEQPPVARLPPPDRPASDRLTVLASRGLPPDLTPKKEPRGFVPDPSHEGCHEQIREALGGGDVDARDRRGLTPLFRAVAPFGGCRDCVGLLLAAGADVNARHRDGRSVVDELYSGVTAALENMLAKEIEEMLRDAGFRDE